MTRSVPRLVVAVLSVTLAGAALSACSQHGGVGSAGTASIGTTTPRSADADTDSSQDQTARDLVDCLAELGVDAEALPGTGIEGYEGTFTDIMIKGPDASWNVPGGLGVYDPLVYGVDFKELLLVVNGQDLTDQFATCIDSSGFGLPSAKFDPREEETTKQAMAEASNQWAACARENGLPNLRDAAVTIDNWETKPSIEVPDSTSAELFKQVLGKCSAVNPDRDLSAGNLIEGNVEQLFDPQITFGGSPDNPRRVALEEALFEHINQVYEAAQ